MDAHLDNTEFAAANYELVDIFKRLNNSVIEAEKELQRRRAALLPSDSNQKKNSSPAVEQYIISEWGKNGRWQGTPCTIKQGGENFSNDLDHLLNTRKPDQIRVIIYKGKKADKIIFDQRIPIIDPNEKPEKNIGFSGLEGIVDEIKNTIKGGDQNDLKLKILKMEMQIESLRNKHESEVREVNLVHLFEMQRLKDENQSLKNKIEEYENDDEGELNGVEENKFIEIIKQLGGGIISTAGENFFRKNPSILTGLGMSDDAVNKFIGSSKQIETPRQQTEASYAEAEVKTLFDLSELPQLHREGIENLVLIFKKLSYENFIKLGLIITSLYDQHKEDIKKDLVEKTTEFLSQTISNH